MAGYGWGSSDWNLSRNLCAAYIRTRVTGAANLRSFGVGWAVSRLAPIINSAMWVAGIEADFSLLDADATSTAAHLAGACFSRFLVKQLHSPDRLAGDFHRPFGLSPTTARCFTSRAVWLAAEVKDNLRVS